MYILQEEKNDLIEWNLNELKQMINNIIDTRGFNKCNLSKLQDKLNQIKRINEV